MPGGKNTPEYRTLRRSSPKFRISVIDNLVTLGGNLLCAGLISSNQSAEIRNSSLSVNERTSILISLLLNKVDQDSSNFQKLIDVLQEDRHYFGSLLKELRLDEAPSRPLTGGTGMSDTHSVLDLVDDTVLYECHFEEVNKSLHQFVNKYQEIALFFGLAISKIEAIRRDCKQDNAKALNEVILSWLRQEHNVGKFGYPSWRNVVKAVSKFEQLKAREIADCHPVVSLAEDGSKRSRWRSSIIPEGEVKRQKLELDDPSFSTLIPQGEVIEFNIRNRKIDHIQGIDDDQLVIERYEPFKLNRQHLNPIRLSFEEIVVPKSGNKTSTIDEYEMKNFPHGIALIINNETFVQREFREGSSTDERNLIQTFRFIGYTVEVHHNLTAMEMLIVMKEMGKRNHNHCDSFVCCILSHGMQGHVFGSDGVIVSLQDLSKKMDANHCPSLAGKPKLFFLQACREDMDMEDKDALVKDSGNQPSQPSDMLVVACDYDTKIPTMADFFFSYATPSGFAAWRDPVHGSAYISELCKALCELSWHASLNDIMTKVCDAVTEYEYYEGTTKYQLTSETTQCLRRNVFF